MSEIADIKQAAMILRNGGLVAFPTETVYGLGARLFDRNAVRRIYTVKGRPSKNPIIVHIAQANRLSALVKEIPSSARKLIDEFWPGPLTLVFKRSPAVPSTVSAGLDTVAVRMPSHPVALKLIRMLGEPVAAPSANLSGRPSATRYEDVLKELGKKVDLILNGGETAIGLESTVVDVTKAPAQLLRPGSITLEQLREVIPDLIYPDHKMNGEKSFPSPGMNYKHYQPDCRVVTVHPERWEKSLSKWKNKDIRLGVLSFSKEIPVQKNIVFKKKIAGNQKRFARHLYSHFFDAENARVQILLVESVEEKGMGLAIMDRLARASESSS